LKQVRGRFDLNQSDQSCDVASICFGIGGKGMPIANIMIVVIISAICLALPTLLVGMFFYTRGADETPKSRKYAIAEPSGEIKSKHF
jgi:hypothetical protein